MKFVNKFSIKNFAFGLSSCLATCVFCHSFKFEYESFNLSSLTIGPYELGHIPVIINAEGERTNIGRRISGSAGIKTGKPTKGLLGYDILKHFVVTIDYSSYKVHIATP